MPVEVEDMLEASWIVAMGEVGYLVVVEQGADQLADELEAD